MADIGPHPLTPSDSVRATRAAKQRAATESTVEALTAQLQRIERTLLALVSSNALTRAQRAEVLGLLAGTRAARPERQPEPNSRAEQDIVDWYRCMDGPKKQIVTRTARLLAQLHVRRGGAR